MDPAVVGSDQFGQLFRTLLPGRYNGATEQMFSQPLVYTPNGDTKQYVYVATTQNNVYKLDAKTGNIIASRNLHIPFLTADLDGCVDINPTIGVTATGVIDPDTDTLYLTAKTYVNQNGGTGPQGRPAGRYYIHALNVNDLSERPGFPVDLEGIVARNNPTRSFGGGIHHQRPALLQHGQYIYAGFASHCVQYNFTGWIVGWDKGSGKIVEQFATEGRGIPNTTPGAGVWMSGGGIASDNAGSIFFSTGNGYASQLSNIPVKGFNPPTSLEEAAVHMSINGDGSLNLVDFFMPWEKQALDGADKDLGTSPLEILPSSFACGDTKRIGVVTGKSGKTYWLNLDNLGGYRNGNNGKNGLDDIIQVYQNDNSVYSGAGVYPLEGGYIYINVIQYPSNIFKFSCNNGIPSFTKVAETPTPNAYILGVSHGAVTSLNGQVGTGLYWLTDVQGLNLRIYNAVPKDGKLQMIKGFNVPGTIKFTRPVFGNGIVYMGTNQGYLYGFGSPVNMPLNCTSPVDFGNVNTKTLSPSKPVTCKASIALTVTDVGLDALTDFSLSGLPTLPLQLAKDQTFTVQAQFKPNSVGFLSSDIIVNTTNSIAGYSISTHARLSGTGQSAGPLLEVSPNSVSFQGVVTGENPNGVTEDLIVGNKGNSPLTITSIQYSTSSSTGPFDTWNGQGDLVVGKFTLQNIPSTIAANTGSPVTIRFDTATSGVFSGFLKFVSDGGTKSVSIAGSAGPAATALLEFQTVDGSGWVEYKNDTAFTFGNVTQNNERSLKFRVTNKAPIGGVSLSLTVSKPPFGVAGIIRAANQVDLAEGTSLAPGESATAVMSCIVPKSQWNVDPYNGTAQWTMNTNDPKLGKQFIQFYCNAVAQQAPPLLPAGDQGRYRYIGCFMENNPGRQLSNQLYGNDAGTNGMCIAACAQKGNIFCGTQYHRECWSGDTIPNQKVDDENCNFECAGDLNQYCGGNGDGTKVYISLFADKLKWDGKFVDQPPIPTTTPTPPTGPIVNPGAEGYTSIGCYTGGTNGRALPNGVNNDLKTVASCLKACKAANNYQFAGLEYGGECWCGTAIGAGSVPAPAKDCNMPCNGNGTELCGGPSRLNAYQLDSVSSSTTTTTVTTAPPTSSDVATTTTSTTTSSTPTGPVIKPTVGAYVAQGCWTPPPNDRVVSDKAFADDTLTLETCATFCDGFEYFGAEYGRECYCGNTPKEGSAKAANQDDCSFPCAGDKFEFCGAGSRMQLYKRGTSTPTTTTSSAADPSGTLADGTTTPTSTTTTSTSTTTSAAATPTHKATVGAYKFQGCWAEPPSGRAINAKVLGDDKMTNDMCAQFCDGYNYFGTQYGRECYCGNALKDGAAQVALGNCSFLCPGDKLQYCGAGVRLDLYKKDDAIVAEPPSTSTSTTTTTTSTSTTPPSTPTTTSTTLVTTTTKATTTTTTTTSASATPTGPIVYKGNTNFTYYSCMSEPSSGKLMDSQVYNNGTHMTVEMCLQVCSKYTWAGVEYGRECWCGNRLSLDGRQAAKTLGKNVTDTDCKTLCPGDKKTFCGAGNRLSLYIRKDQVLNNLRAREAGFAVLY